MESKPAKRRFSSMDNESIEPQRIQEIIDIENEATDERKTIHVAKAWFDEFSDRDRLKPLCRPLLVNHSLETFADQNTTKITAKSADLLRDWYTDILVRFCTVNAPPLDDILVGDPNTLITALVPSLCPLDLYKGTIDSARITSLDYFNVFPLDPNSRVQDLGSDERVVIAEFKSTGTMGLSNLGNSCYMNSSLQCLVHIPQMVEYFISDKYLEDINTDNPIGYGGMAAEAFTKLIKALYTGQGSSYSPSQFKTTMGRFNRSFAGYLQQDSQEFTAFLLDALHEDLNRIKQKPVTEKPELPPDKINDSGAVAELAQTCWKLHKKRNDSIILDLFTGLYKSTLVCPACDRVSITFDPFGDLTLPFPDLTLWVHNIYYYAADGAKLEFEIVLQTHSSIAQLKAQVRQVTGRPECALEVAEIHNYKIWQWFRDSDTLGDKIGKDDVIAVYESEERCLSVLAQNNSQFFAVPLLVHISEKDTLKDVREKLRQRFKTEVPFRILKQSRNSQSESMIYMHRLESMEPIQPRTPNECINEEGADGNGEEPQFQSEPESSPASRPEPFEIISTPERKEPLFGPYDVIVCDFDAEFISTEPEVVENPIAKKANERLNATKPLTLEDCFDLFSTPEVLGENDLWYCSECKEFRQATKKIELWKLPQIFTIHLKRFRDIHSSRDKINDVVDFPITGLDMTERVLGANGEAYIYDLVAVDNHFGGLGGGHYTSFAKNPISGEWFYFNDSSVSEADPEDSVNGAAYLLFYSRRNASGDTRNTAEFAKVLDVALNSSRRALRDKMEEKHKEYLAGLEAAAKEAAKASLTSPPDSPPRFEGQGNRLGGSETSQGMWGNGTSFLDKNRDSEVASPESSISEISN